MHTLAWWPTLVVLAIATYTDLRSQRIPNWLVLPFLLAGIGASAWQQGWTGIAHSLEGFALGAALFGLLYWIGGMGAGDVKLCAAIGAWIGPNQLLIAIVLTAIAGGILALVWAASQGFLKELLLRSVRLALRKKEYREQGEERMTLDHPRARKMPYAPAIAIGTLLSFFAH
jgi:prepilin peptidase CpaA